MLKFIVVITSDISKTNTNLSELNWCIYDVSLKKQITEEIHQVVSPQEESTNINTSMEAGNEKDILSKLENSISPYDNKHTLSVYDTEESREVLMKSMKRQNLKIPKCLNQMFNLIQLFKFYNLNLNDYEKEENKILALFNHFNLKIINSIRKSVTSMNSIVRLINKAVKDGFSFIITSPEADSAKEPPKIHDFINYIKPSKAFFIHIYGIKQNYLQTNLKEIFEMYNVEEDDVALIFNVFGRYINECIIRINDILDYNELYNILNFFSVNDVNTYSKSIYCDRLITISNSSYQNFTKAKESFSISHVSNESSIYDDNQFIKVKNLPLLSTEDSLFKAFENYPIAFDGVKFKIDKYGVKQGSCIVAFYNPIDLSRFPSDISVNGTKVTIEKSSLKEFETYASSGVFHYLNFNIIKYLDKSFAENCLLLFNLPLSITEDEVVQIVKSSTNFSFRLIVDDILLHQYGCGILFFSFKSELSKATSELNKEFSFNQRSYKFSFCSVISVLNKEN